MSDARVAFAYILIVIGVLWTFLGGLCEGLGVLMAMEASNPDWPNIALNGLWVAPGVAALMGGMLTLRAVRRADRRWRRGRGDGPA